jgi:hypothetical protein
MLRPGKELQMREQLPNDSLNRDSLIANQPAPSNTGRPVDTPFTPGIAIFLISYYVQAERIPNRRQATRANRLKVKDKR